MSKSSGLAAVSTASTVYRKRVTLSLNPDKSPSRGGRNPKRRRPVIGRD